MHVNCRFMYCPVFVLFCAGEVEYSAEKILGKGNISKSSLTTTVILVYTLCTQE